MIMQLAIRAWGQCLSLIRNAILAVFVVILALPISSEVFSRQPDPDHERLVETIVHAAACAGATVLAQAGGRNELFEAAAVAAGVHGLRQAPGAQLAIDYHQSAERSSGAAFAFTAILHYQPQRSLIKRALDGTSRWAVKIETITDTNLDTCTHVYLSTA